jgi:polyisoprenoid-binding protein YceI
MSRPWQGRGSRVLLVGVVLWGLAGCQTSPPAAPAPTVAAVGQTSSAIPAGAQELKVVAGESLLQVLVYRGGAMARLGHNHVIASHQLTGSVYLTDDLAATRFEINFPVNGLTVDEPALREAAGPDFPPAVPQGAREGTHANLLSEPLLDGVRYPTIRLRASAVKPAANGFEATVEITLKDQTHLVTVPVAVQRSEGQLIASGEFPLKQSELGLKPFSIAMGALVVLDQMQVRFRVTARQ